MVNQPDIVNHKTTFRVGLLLVVVILLLIGIPFVLRLKLLESRGFNPDEFEHLHFAWSVANGRVPYRDYFDHHTPLLHFALSPLARRFDVARSTNEALRLLVAARRASWIAAGLTFVLAGFVGTRHRNATAGLTASLLLANTAVFLSKSLEVRPDVYAGALVCAAVLCAMRGVGGMALKGVCASAWFFASGLVSCNRSC